MTTPSHSQSVHPDMLGVGPIEWDSATERAHRRDRRKASTIHGWLVKMRGTLLGRESTRRVGIREMREAAAVRKYKKQHPEQFRGRPKGSVFWIFPKRSTRARSRSHHDRRDDRHDRSHSRRDDRHHRDRHDRRDYRERPNAYHGERGHGPCLHFHHRVKPHYHGHGTYLAGVLTGRHHVRDKGMQLKERGEKERRRERRRRKRQRKAEALAIKVDGALNKNRWWHR
ncbi:hypothetical protein LXA43DRAFT_897586 [Ganoderma leucocontextum]|nr:hypothetical protein LXA43DRAFT_897586 [Ganoderma leucocontextum]